MIMFWHVVSFLFAASAYAKGRILVRNQYEGLGILHKGLLQTEHELMYRRGKDAVAVGNIMRAYGIGSFFITIADVFSQTNLGIYAIIIMIIIYNTIIAHFYPVEYEPAHFVRNVRDEQINKNQTQIPDNSEK